MILFSDYQGKVFFFFFFFTLCGPILNTGMENATLQLMLFSVTTAVLLCYVSEQLLFIMVIVMVMVFIYRIFYMYIIKCGLHLTTQPMNHESLSRYESQRSKGKVLVFLLFALPSYLLMYIIMTLLWRINSCKELQRLQKRAARIILRRKTSRHSPHA